MLSARNADGDVLASQVTKDDGPFTCPMCRGSVLVKKGRVRIHHFSHIPPTDCAYGVGESEIHRRAKLDIYEALQRHPEVTKLQLERPLGDVRPDISFYLKKVPVAIEVQVSTLPLDTIERRTRLYTQKGISLLWASPYQSSLEDGEKYSPALWEKYLHALYFGKVYYWVTSDMLLPVHFDPYQIWVEESSWWEGEGEDAYERSEGGYDRFSKRYRTPRFLDQVGITSLASVSRKAWRSKTMSIPAAKLWCEPYQ